ncbi:hypothetical protein MUDAN_BIHEEGNE_01306 [Lactiplantibacillus mudanjiangensis]|nr:hypothetical protein MUDAN_BIHEEGNE_01306 [Lactiplantibacillus mudanjiangensis]
MTKPTKNDVLMPHLYTITATKATPVTRVYSTPIRYTAKSKQTWHYQLTN